MSVTRRSHLRAGITDSVRLSGRILKNKRKPLAKRGVWLMASVDHLHRMKSYVELPNGCSKSEEPKLRLGARCSGDSCLISE